MTVCWLTILFAAFGWAAVDCPPDTQFSPDAQKRFQTLDRQAQVEFRHGDFAKAAQDFQSGVCMLPESARSYYRLYAAAVTAIVAGDFPRSREALTEADRLRPDYPVPLAMLIKVSLLSSDVGSIRSFLRILAERFPNNNRLRADLAQDLLHANQHDLALAESLRLAQSGYNDPKCMLNLAVLENEVGAFRDSVRHALSIEERPGIAENMAASAAAVAGLNYESLGLLDQAIPHLKLAIRLAPHEENAYLSLARILEALHKSEAALNVLQQGREQIPDSPRIQLALATGLIASGQYSASARVLHSLIEKFPDQLEAYPKLAETCRAMGEPSRATEALRRLAARNPAFPMIHVIIAESMLDEGSIDYPGVLRELDEAEKISPDDSAAYELRGKAFIGLHQYVLAIAALRRAIELQPTNSNVYYQLGLAYRRSGQTELAKQQFDRVHFLKDQGTLAK
jgi:tetratricopeptide (TPR) repeat protein